MTTETSLHGPEVEPETDEVHGAEDDELSKNLTERLGLGGLKQVSEAS